jgi:type II secretion system protein L
MARPVLVIDIGRDTLRACGFMPGKDSAEVLSEATLDGDLKAALASLLGEMESSGFSSFARVYLGLPAGALTMRKVSLPIKEKKKVEEVLPFELEDNLARDTTEFVFGALPLADGSTLAVGVEKPMLREYLSTLGELGIEPSWVGCSLFAKERLLSRLKGSDEAAAFLDTESIVISNGRGPLLYKSVRSADDIRLALAAIEHDGLEVGSFYSAGSAARALLPPGREAMDAPGIDERFTGLRALLMQIKEGGLAEAVNFRKGEFADTSAVERAKKGFRLTVGLVLIVAVLWGGFVYVRSRRLAEGAEAVKREIMSSYKRAFPADKTVRAPLYRLEIKMKEQAGDLALMGMGAPVLEVMKRMAGPAATAGVSLYEFSMRSGRLTAKGRAESFEQAVKFKSGLLRLKDAGDVALTDVKTSVSGGVTFSVSMELGGAGSGAGGM